MSFKETILELWNSKLLPASSLIICDDTNKIKLEFYQFINEALNNITNVSAENNTDIIKIEQDDDRLQKSISIDEVRKLQTSFYSKSGISNYKFAIIVGAENMTLNASNSLLKILEDTYQDSYIFLIVRNESKLIPTIKSRLIKIYEDKKVLKNNEGLHNDILYIISPDVRFDDKTKLIDKIIKENNSSDILLNLVDCLNLIMKNKKGVNLELDNLIQYFEKNSVSYEKIFEECKNLRALILNSINSSIDIKQIIFLTIAGFSNLK